MLSHFDQVRDWITALQQKSKEQCGKGYSLRCERIQHRKLGEQWLPAIIEFECMDDYLLFINKSTTFSNFQRLASESLELFPEFDGWLKKYPLKLLDHEKAWPNILLVCSWFQHHPQPKQYIRELDIEGIDSKFIEQHKTLLTELLNLILPSTAIHASITGLSNHGFERRFGLKYDEPLIRFRLLDNGEAFSDISVPFSQFSRIAANANTIFITENKINGLSFPAMPRSMVIFGLGYGIEMLKEVAWLADRKIIYWGDIDTHGFAIMAQLRSYFSQVESLCMDEATLLAHQHLWGSEVDEKRHMGHLKNLTSLENRLFTKLQRNDLGRNIRLEQERIRLTWLKSRLRDLS